MWYKVELGADDAILSIVEVEQNERNKRRVVYVQADSKENAVIAAQRWARIRAADSARVAERRQEQRAAGKCQYGKCQYSPASGKLYCPDHLAKMREAVTAYNAGVRIRPVRTDAEKYDNRTEQSLPIYRRMKVLEECLSAYRREASFEVWLTGQIRAAQVKLNARKKSAA